MKSAIYAGSFSPMHIGHLDIAIKASRIFDRVYIVKALNLEKKDSKYPFPVEFLKEKYNFFPVELPYGELLTDFITRIEKRNDLYGAYNGESICLVRGLRNTHDLLYEQNLEAAYKQLKPDINIIYIFSDPKYNFISSSLLRSYGELDKFKHLIVK